MMPSEALPDEAFVWIWLPGKTDPVVAGRLWRESGRLAFNYGRSYLARPDAIAIYEPELPLVLGPQSPPFGLALPSCIRDAAPDAWGRRVILNRRFGAKRANIDVDRLDELTYLLESGSDRIGALDFQRSPERYEAREAVEATFEELIHAAELVQQGAPLTPGLERALFYGSSIGGARPKTLIRQGDRKLIAKFSAQNDVMNVVKAEFIAMRLAAHVGLNVAPVSLAKSAGRDILLVERFDREPKGEGWTRKAMVSALTLFGLDEMMARYASYEDLAETIRHRFTEPSFTLKELYGRIVFNILVGNTDDHARNHAAFWDGKGLTLTPAYDICPQARSGNEASQAMMIFKGDRMSRLRTCLDAASAFHLTHKAAAALIVRQIETIRGAWDAVCDEADLAPVDRNQMWGRQFLNAFAFEDVPEDMARLQIG